MILSDREIQAAVARGDIIITDCPPSDSPRWTSTTLDLTLDPKLAAQLDQSAAAFAEAFPVLLWGFYQGCQAQGFDQAQAFHLTNTLLYSMMIKPQPPEGG